MSVHQEFEALLRDSPAKEKLALFYKLVLDENEIQNLTRITAPQDFFDKNIGDVQALIDSGELEYPALDMGSGMGVPGLVAAILTPGEWVLAESEKKKAEFLQKAVQALGLEASVTIYPGRAEDYLKNKTVKTVVARAVGPVSRIWGWLRRCSTWNKLILFKGPGWESEWNEFPVGEKKKLRVAKIQDYRVGPEQPERKLVYLERVPRGTTE